MDTKEFRSLIKTELKPVLNELGFIGTNHHFIKRTNDHYIFTLVIQANKYGGSCIMELGVHLDFLLDEKNSNITVYDCEFRQRIQPKKSFISKLFKNNAEIWHEYGEDEEQAKQSIASMKSLFVSQGMDYFNQFKNFPNPLLTIDIEEIKKRSKRLEQLGAPLDLRLVLLISKTHLYLGNKKDAKKYADWGLKNIGRATLLIKEFEGVLQEV
ncbi:DUF4304 domain-containing protein [Paenibacillus wynnii]|uniref:DUF4304 domain-containing protein n=1 Tax=Paenibacillus wynnii TaxID=268407 RepID=UPI00278E8B1D|nr:DUF4304 domain-containing protein [Paenibacillus wynnii]MDQ0193383.1 hypothetical protein [Paenibacillus wynnii]